MQNKDKNGNNLFIFCQVLAPLLVFAWSPIPEPHMKTTSPLPPQLFSNSQVIMNYRILPIKGASPNKGAPYSLEQVNTVRTDQNWHSFLNNCLIFKSKPALESSEPQLSVCIIRYELARAPGALIRQNTVYPFTYLPDVELEHKVIRIFQLTGICTSEWPIPEESSIPSRRFIDLSEWYTAGYFIEGFPVTDIDFGTICIPTSKTGWLCGLIWTYVDLMWH